MATNTFYSGTRRLRPARIVTYLDAMEVVEEGNADAIVVLPPEAGDDGAAASDTEDVPDDLGNEEPFEAAGEFEVDGLSDSSSSEDDEPLAKRSKPEERRWRKRVAFDKALEKSPLAIDLLEEYPELLTATPYNHWRNFFTEDMLTNIVTQTELYARRDQNNVQFSLQRSDLNAFLGTILLSGYNCLPHEDHYWSNSEDLGVDIVSENISRATFRSIKKYIHFADNQNLEVGNKVAKIAPLYTALNEAFVQFGVFHEDLSVDESMVPYFGRHSSKQFIRGKPIRFGYKLWSLCGADGFPYHLKVYTGKEAGATTNTPLGTRVVEHMVKVVKENGDVKCHHMYFDNFFTSYALLSSLSKDGMQATGTIRDNRTGGANKDLKTTKAMKKAPRGDFDYR